MNKIVEFPKSKIVREATNEEYVNQAKEKGKVKYADGIIDDIISIVLTELENQGIETDDFVFLKDFSMAADSLRATVYRQFDIEHPLQSFIDKNVNMIDRKTGKIVENLEDFEEN